MSYYLIVGIIILVMVAAIATYYAIHWSTVPRHGRYGLVCTVAGGALLTIRFLAMPGPNPGLISDVAVAILVLGVVLHARGELAARRAH
jgi:hypothetical protein